MDVRKFMRRSARNNTIEHSIVQVAVTLVTAVALAPASPVVACLWLIGVAIIRGAAPNA